MRRLGLTTAIGMVALGCASAGHPATSGGYAVQKAVRVGGAGGFDYVYADSANRRLYVPRGGAGARVMVYDLDSFDSTGILVGTNARGVAVDQASGHGFASSKPVAMWDARTLAPIRTIDVEGNPDGILADQAAGRVWVFSHSTPNATVIDATSGTVVGTVDLGGAPEQAVSDGQGHLYVDIEDQGNVAVVDTRTLAVTAHYSLAGKGGTCTGLAFDAANRLLFATCRNPAAMVVLGADDGRIVATLPIGAGTDGAVFDPVARDVFSSNGEGTLTIVHESSPTSFTIAQTLATAPSAKTLTFDARTRRVLLIAADFGPPPAPGPSGRPGRGALIADSFRILVVGK